MNEAPLKKIEYLISVLTENTFTSQNKWNLNLKIIGDKSESQEFLLDNECLDLVKQGTTVSSNHVAYVHRFKKLDIKEVGKVKKLIWIDNFNLSSNGSLIYELQIEIPYRNELLIFPIQKAVSQTMSLILEPNLNSGDIGVHYAVVCHTNPQQKTYPKSHSNIVIQIKGEKNNTNFIPLQHSQLNKIPFLASRRDIFDVYGVDVGKITKVILRNHNETITDNSWFVDYLEIRTFNHSHVYNFHVTKNLLPNEEIELTPMSHSEIDYEVVLRYNELENEHHQPMKHHKLNDIYFIICGEKGSTKKIYLNNYESRPQTDANKRERFFEFKSEDVGKILKINVSLNEDNDPNNCIFIEYIEIKIPFKKEAYKFPCERTLGAFFEDGRLELDLQCWKHPEKKIHIDYELKNETNASDKNTHGTVYLIIHGDHGKTGKIELNDGSLENSSSDEYLFNAPDVGKIIKIELFYTPTYPNSMWRIDSLEIKISSRNEAYKFPAQIFMNKQLNCIELEPWKKPDLCCLR